MSNLWCYLSFLKEYLLLDVTNLPNSYYEAKKIIWDLGHSSKKIDAYGNDCLLIWKDKNCHRSMFVVHIVWKMLNIVRNQIENRKKDAMQYFTLFSSKTKASKNFVCSKTSPLTSWYNYKRVDVLIMRHPIESMAWNFFYELHLFVVVEYHNVCFGLLVMVSNHLEFRELPTIFGMWYLFLTLFPLGFQWSKRILIFLMLIPCPSGTSDVIDFYTKPLIQELN